MGHIPSLCKLPLCIVENSRDPFGFFDDKNVSFNRLQVSSLRIPTAHLMVREGRWEGTSPRDLTMAMQHEHHGFSQAKKTNIAMETAAVQWDRKIMFLSIFYFYVK